MFWALLHAIPTDPIVNILADEPISEYLSLVDAMTHPTLSVLMHEICEALRAILMGSAPSSTLNPKKLSAKLQRRRFLIPPPLIEYFEGDTGDEVWYIVVQDCQLQLFANADRIDRATTFGYCKVRGWIEAGAVAALVHTQYELPEGADRFMRGSIAFTEDTRIPAEWRELFRYAMTASQIAHATTAYASGVLAFDAPNLAFLVYSLGDSVPNKHLGQRHHAGKKILRRAERF